MWLVSEQRGKGSRQPRQGDGKVPKLAKSLFIGDRFRPPPHAARGLFEKGHRRCLLANPSAASTFTVHSHRGNQSSGEMKAENDPAFMLS